MVKKIKFLSPQSTYRELKDLLESTSLKTIPLVDSKGLCWVNKNNYVGGKIIIMCMKSHCQKKKVAVIRNSCSCKIQSHIGHILVYRYSMEDYFHCNCEISSRIMGNKVTVTRNKIHSQL